MVSHHPAKFGSHSHCFSRYIIVLVCHAISQDHVIKGLCDFKPLMVKHHPVKSGNHGDCGRRYVFSVEEQDFTCSLLLLHL